MDRRSPSHSFHHGNNTIQVGETLRRHWSLDAMQAHTTTALSPPPTPLTESSLSSSTSRSEKLSVKLRSNSGLAHHTNQAAFRRYTDYNRDGSTNSPISPSFTYGGQRLASPVLVSAGTSGAKASSTERLAESFITSETPLLDLFHRDVLQLLLQQPTAGERLCRFAQTRGGRVNADFLLKVHLTSATKGETRAYSADTNARLKSTAVNWTS